MARPQKQTVDYFPHYVNQGKTLLILENEFHNDGYVFWFKLLELLCKSDGQFYDYNNSAAWRLLLAETRVPEDMGTEILKVLADIDAIDSDLYKGKIIWVQKLVEACSSSTPTIAAARWTTSTRPSRRIPTMPRPMPPWPSASAAWASQARWPIRTPSPNRRPEGHPRHRARRLAA